MVGLGRVELPTNGLGNRCSIHLSYRPDGDGAISVAQTLGGFKAAAAGNVGFCLRISLLSAGGELEVSEDGNRRTGCRKRAEGPFADRFQGFGRGSDAAGRCARALHAPLRIH